MGFHARDADERLPADTATPANQPSLCVEVLLADTMSAPHDQHADSAWLACAGLFLRRRSTAAMKAQASVTDILRSYIQHLPLLMRSRRSDPCDGSPAL